MKDYNLQIIINTVLKNSWIINFKKSINEATKSTLSFSEKIAKISAEFTAISTVAWTLKEKLWGFFWNAIEQADQLSNAMTGLESIVKWTKNNFWEAKNFIQDFTKDWLVTTWDAASALKNLLASWYWMKDATVIMNRLKDAAAFGRQSHLTLWEAVKTATEWIKNENSVLVDNAWVSKNLSVIWDEYAKSIWKTAKTLTAAEKRQATVNWIIKETQFQVWDATKLTDQYWGKKAKLNATMSNLASTIWSILLPALKDLIDLVEPMIQWIIDWANANPWLAKTIVIIAWGLTWLLIAFTAVSAIIPLVSWWFSLLSTTFVWLWKALLFLTTSPLWLVITGIWLLVAAWIALYKNWDTVKKKLEEFWNYIVECWNWIKEKFNEFIEYIVEFWKEIYDNLIPPFQVIVDWIGEIFSNLWEFVKSIFQTWVDLVVGICQAFWAFITWDWEKAWEILKETCSQFWENICNIFKNFINLVWSIIKTGLDFVLSIFVYVWDSIKNATSELWESIKNIVVWIWDSIKNWVVEKWNNFVDYLFQLWEDFKTWAKNFFKGFVDWIISIIMAPFNALKAIWDFISWIWNKITWKQINVWMKTTTENIQWGRAYWWPVSAGKSYLVWERWKELFVPERNWNIIPNNKLWWNTINISITWNNISNEADENRLAQKIIEKLNHKLQMSHFGIS